MGANDDNPKKIRLSRQIQGNFDVLLMAEVGYLAVYREPNAVAPHVRFWGGGIESNPVALLTVRQDKLSLSGVYKQAKKLS